MAALNPDAILSEGWQEQYPNPNDPNSTEENTYAYVRRYADGRVSIDYYTRNSNAGPVHVERPDAKQAKIYADSQPAPRTAAGDAQDANATELERQRKANAALPADQDPRYETDADRAARARQTILDQGATAERQQTNREQADAVARQAAATAESNRLAQARLDAEAANSASSNARADRAEGRAEAAANRPQPISAPPTQRRITQQNADGSISSVDNPNFDQAGYDQAQAKEAAQAERDRLALQIQAGKLQEDQAAARYKQWFAENVTLPMQRAQEARARAEELRAAQAAEDRRKEYAASYEKDRATTALNIGQTAASNFNSNLQYQVGPKFGEQFAQALNSFQPGAPPAKFTADAFTFKGPNIEAVARKATANALSNISPYAKAISTAGDRPLAVAQYDESMTPASIAPTPQPEAPPPIDYGGMVNDYLQSNPYTPAEGS